MEDQKLLQKFPLSKKKLYKKVIEKFFLVFFSSFVISFITFFVISAFSLSINLWRIISISIAIGLAFFLIVMALYVWYVIYYIKTYYYENDGHFLTIRKGVFAPTEIHVQYLKIQDVYVDQDILDRIMGLYDVHISSATYSSGMEAHIDGLDKAVAHGLKDLLLEKIKNSAKETNSANNQENLPVNEITGSNKAKFSFPISSKVYDLSKEWWISELVKLAIGIVFTPAVISLWAFFSITENREANSTTWLIIFFVWLAATVCTLLYRLGYLYLWKSHYAYDFGEEYIYMKEGVLSVSEKNMGYNTIQDVKIHQTFVDRLFKVADLVIENASPSAPITYSKYGAKAKVGINGVSIEGLSLVDARKISEELKKVILNKSSLKKGL